MRTEIAAKMSILRSKPVFTLAVFGTSLQAVRRLKRKTIIAPIRYGFHGWNRDHAHEPGRIEGSGSFTFVGLRAVRSAAMQYLAEPHVDQVAVRTNHGHDVYRYYKRPDGTITGYLDRT